MIYLISRKQGGNLDTDILNWCMSIARILGLSSINTVSLNGPHKCLYPAANYLFRVVSGGAFLLLISYITVHSISLLHYFDIWCLSLSDVILLLLTAGESGPH